MGVELNHDPEAGYVGPLELWQRETAEVWDLAGRRRGRLVAYDVLDLVEEPLPSEARQRLAHTAAAVGDLLSITELEETKVELSSAVAMTQSVVERQEERRSRVSDHVETTVRTRVRDLVEILRDARPEGRSAGAGNPGGRVRPDEVPRALSVALEIERDLDDVAVAREGLDAPATQVCRLEDLVDEALGGLAPLVGGRELAEVVQVVSVRDARLMVGGTEVARALRHLLTVALAGGVGAGSPAARVEVDVEERGDLLLVTLEDDGTPERTQALRRSLAAGLGGTDDADAGVPMTFVRAVVEAHGGRVWVEDAELGGVKICLTLPAAPPSDLRRPGEASVAAARPPAHPSRRSLDDPDPDGPEGPGATSDGPDDDGPDDDGPDDPVPDPHTSGQGDGSLPDNVRGLFDRR